MHNIKSGTEVTSGLYTFLLSAGGGYKSGGDEL